MPRRRPPRQIGDLTLRPGTAGTFLHDGLPGAPCAGSSPAHPPASHEQRSPPAARAPLWIGALRDTGAAETRSPVDLGELSRNRALQVRLVRPVGRSSLT